MNQPHPGFPNMSNNSTLLETLGASGRSSEKLSLPTLQSKMKCDPEGYESELHLIYNQFKAGVDLFEQQAAMSFYSVSGIGADPSVAKELGDRSMFLAHVTPFYPKQLAGFPNELADFLRNTARSMPSGLRHHVSQGLILLVNRNIIGIEETLLLFMELQTLGDRNVSKLAFSHVVQCVSKMNQKHRNDVKNRALQSIVFSMLQQEDEVKAKRALVTLCELHRRKVWFDERTANAICMACFHSSSRIMISGLSFLLDYEKLKDGDDSDASNSDDEASQSVSQVVISKEAMYKAHHSGTNSSKKKKKAKLQRTIRNVKRQLRKDNSIAHYSPLKNLEDAQGFVEKLFSRLHACNERFEVKMMMLKVVARTIGLHRLILLRFYPFLQKYAQPHQPDITNLLAAAVEACHDMVPPDAVEPLFKQIVNMFVHDRSRPESIAVGLNVIREICLRMPLLMTEDLLQDLVLYKKSHEKAVSAGARSLIMLFREVCPALLIKKDRGRPTDPNAKPKEYGEVDVPSNVPGLELLEEEVDSDVGSDADEVLSNDEDQLASRGSEDEAEQDDDDDDEEDEVDGEVEIKEHGDIIGSSERNGMESGSKDKSSGKKRKMSDFDVNLITAETSLRARKRLTQGNVESPSPGDERDGILSNEDFQRIKRLKAEKALAQQGFRVPNADQLSKKRVDPSTLEAYIKHKLSKDERLALVRAGRDDRGKYQARAAIKQKKTGGMSNRQKEHKKSMPLAAKRAKVARSKGDKRKKQRHGGTQFRGKKAWK